MDEIVSLYQSVFGCDPISVVPIAGEGSNRKYFRVNGSNGSCIATIGTSLKENDAFIYLSQYFSKRLLPVPEVIAIDQEHLSYIQTDVGSVSLYDLIRTYGPESENVEPMLNRMMEMLPRFHYSIDGSFDADKCFPRQSMDERALMWDLNYFKYSFLKPVGLEFDEDRLEDDFRQLVSLAASNIDHTLMLRDFQSRNVMIFDGNPSVIDFQGARMGDGLYDVASFVWQARAGFSLELKKRLVATYRHAVAEYTGKEPVDFDQRLSIMVLVRLLQVLGAYGFRGFFERKSRFLDSIPTAVASLHEAIGNLPNGILPYLREVISHVAGLPFLQKRESLSGLTVCVMSFSYKKGIPEDRSGNGGGFVFDCRAMHNPGRYDEYKHLTGLDKPVIDFLEDRGEIQRFLSGCYDLVDSSVDCYIRRGFSDLMVCFGCTGGRHRSVYCAEHMARYLNDKYGVRVRMIHREQNIDITLEPK